MNTFERLIETKLFVASKLNFSPLSFLLEGSALCWLALSGLSVAHANDAIEEVAVIGTRVETPVSELGSNLSILDAEQLEAVSAVHIQQSLSQVPGVSYHRGNGQESLPAIRSAVLTGAGACGNVLIMEEAIPVRAAGFCNVNELFDTHFEHASRIEVVRGSGSVFYGSNALLGSINAHLPSVTNNRVSLELGLNQYVRGKLALGYADETRYQGALYLSVSDDGGFRDDSGYQQQKLSWRHQQQLNDWNLSLGSTFTNLDQQTAGFVSDFDAYRDPQRRRQNFDPEAFRKTTSFRAWAGLEKQFGAASLHIRPYIRVSDMDFLLHFLPGDPLEQNQQSGVGIQSSLSIEHSSQLKSTFGIDLEYSEGELQQTQATPTRGSAFLQATIPVGTHYDYQVDAKQAAVFANLDWKPAERWQVIAGLRLENLDYEYDNLSLDGRTKDDGTECGFGGCRYSRPADRSDSFTYLSPKIEVKYLASERLTFHAAASESNRAPQATELYRLQRAQRVADLDEVSANHVEVGVAWQSERLSAKLIAYQIEQSNVIIRDSDFFNIDGQKIDSKGIELEFEADLSQTLKARMAVSLSDHTYASNQFIGEENINGNKVDTAPDRVMNAQLVWQPQANLSAQVELQHVDDYFLEPQNNFTYPGHTLVNIRGRYQFSDDLSASLRLLNAGNRLYAERADYTGFTGYRYFPGETRALYGELSWQF